MFQKATFVFDVWGLRYCIYVSPRRHADSSEDSWRGALSRQSREGLSFFHGAIGVFLADNYDVNNDLKICAVEE